MNGGANVLLAISLPAEPSASEAVVVDLVIITAVVVYNCCI